MLGECDSFGDDYSDSGLDDRPGAVSTRMPRNVERAARERNPDASGVVDGVALGVLEEEVFLGSFLTGAVQVVDPAREGVVAS